MASLQALKQELFMAIEKLPEDRLPEVLDFVDFLLSRTSRYTSVSSEQLQTQSSGTDPLHAFIGGAEHGSLARGIDEDLYG